MHTYVIVGANGWIEGVRQISFRYFMECTRMTSSYLILYILISTFISQFLSTCNFLTNTTLAWSNQQLVP